MSELSISNASQRMGMIVSHLVKHMTRPDLTVRGEDKVFNDSITELQSFEDHIIEYLHHVSQLKTSLESVISTLCQLSECAGRLTKAEEDGTQTQSYHQALAPYLSNIKDQLSSVFEASYMAPVEHQLSEFQQIKVRADGRVALIMERRHYETKVKLLEAKTSGSSNFSQKDYNDAFSRPSEIDGSYIRPSLQAQGSGGGFKNIVHAQQEKSAMTKLARNSAKLEQVNAVLQTGTEQLCSDLDQMDTFRKTIIYSQAPSLMTYSVELLESLTNLIRELDLTVNEVEPTVTTPASYLQKYRKSVHVRHLTEGVALGELYTPDPTANAVNSSASTPQSSLLSRASNVLTDFGSALRKTPASSSTTTAPSIKPPPPPPPKQATKKEDDADSVDSWEGGQAVNPIRSSGNPAFMSELGANLAGRRSKNVSLDSSAEAMKGNDNPYANSYANPSPTMKTLPPPIPARMNAVPVATASQRPSPPVPSNLPPLPKSPPVPPPSEQDDNNVGNNNTNNPLFSKPTLKKAVVTVVRRSSGQSLIVNDSILSSSKVEPPPPTSSQEDAFNSKPQSARVSIKVGDEVFELPSAPVRRAPVPPGHVSSSFPKPTVAQETEGDEGNDNDFAPPLPLSPRSTSKPAGRPPPRPDSVEADLASSSPASHSSFVTSPSTQKRFMSLSMLLKNQSDLGAIGDADAVGDDEEEESEQKFL